MAIKIYVKRGSTNYKEKRMIRELEEVLAKKAAEDPNFETNFKPATNPEELKMLHNLYCVEDVSFEEVPDKEKEHKNFRDALEEDIKSNTEEGEISNNNDDLDEDAKFVDPFNRDETIVRDYVMDDGFKDEKQDDQPKKTTFEEPQSFGESFEMPGNDIGNQRSDNGPKKKEKTKEQPINPSFDDMGSGRKKRSTKKFAKYIVEGVCMLAEKGFQWWTTKDITESKLAEYELSGEYDFNVLLTLETGQEVYVKQWFNQQRITAEQLSKFEQEEKDDLAEVLAEVLNEKGFAPTPMQELMIITAKVIGGKALIAIQMSAGIKNVLAQLKVNNEQQPQPQQQPQRTQEEINKPIVEWDNDIMDETAEAVGNPAIDNQLTTTE